MLVTEEQAKEMVCPLPRHESTGNGCYGSRCMWWRWGAETRTRFRAAHDDDGNALGIQAEPDRPNDVPASWIWVPAKRGIQSMASGWQEPRPEAHARRLGYCGAAGKP